MAEAMCLRYISSLAARDMSFVPDMAKRDSCREVDGAIKQSL